MLDLPCVRIENYQVQVPAAGSGFLTCILEYSGKIIDTVIVEILTEPAFRFGVGRRTVMRRARDIFSEFSLRDLQVQG